VGQPNASYDAVVVGSGPNGLAAAITLARAGRSVAVIEAQDEPGGGAQSAELTQPGFIHDVFSAVHPLALESEFFQSLPLEQFGLKWLHSPTVYAHPLEGGEAVLLHRSVSETAAALGRDERTYKNKVGQLLEYWDYYKSEILRPIRFPRHPFRLAGFGIPALLPAKTLARLVFRETRLRALFAGSAAHSTLSMDAPGSSAFALTLMLAGHQVGWPLPRGGARSVSQALIAYFRSLGGEIFTGTRVQKLAQLPRASAILFDLTPRQIVAIAGAELGSSFRSRLAGYKYGPGVFKLDWALRGPIPWKSAQVAQAATVHLGGTLEEIALSESEVAKGRVAERPFVLLVQPSLFDSTRAPAGCHTAWAYCHVPNGSTFDMTDRIEAQIERFAPGFREVILARSVLNPQALESRNANLVGGDINGGSVHLPQLFIRPTSRLYSTSRSELFICSSSTPPGGGVHGLCGYYAAQEALRSVLKV
jgi:phytoene dehydrogenase-like protein